VRNETNDGDRLGHTERLVISCDTCVMAHTDACDDCLVTALCGSPSSEAVVFDLEEQRAVRLLTQAGMVPTLRHRAAG
jgi:hypothetical protein